MRRLAALGADMLKGPQGRFLIAGAFASLVNWLVRFPLELVMPFALSVLAAMAIGMICGFLLYDRWVFPGSARPLIWKIRDFLAINFVSQSIMFVVSVGVRELLLLAADWGTTIAGATAHLVGISCGAIFSYFGHRSVTFSATRK